MTDQIETPTETAPTPLADAIVAVAGETIAQTWAGVEFTFTVREFPESVLAEFFRAGLSKGQDTLNRQANEYKKASGREWSPADRQTAFDTLLQSYREGRINAKPIGDVHVTAINLAIQAVLDALGAKSWNEAAASNAGKKYFKATSNGKTVQPQYEALRTFITANPALNIMARAEQIVADRAKAADGSVEVKL